MKSLILTLVLVLILVAIDGKKSVKSRIKLRCKRSPRPCGGGGGSIERISVIGRRPPSFPVYLPSWIFTGNRQVGSNEGGGGDGGADGGKDVKYVIVLKLKDGASGKKVVLEVIKEVEKVLGKTNSFLLKIAWVESQFGTHKDTYRKGYNGGIFQVDYIGFKDTQNIKSHPGLKAKFEKIQEAFGIDWSKVTWKDLRKPLYSAIAARLYLLNKPGAIPSSLKGQAEYWKKNYNSNHPNAGGTITKFENRWNAYIKSQKKKSSPGTGNQPGYIWRRLGQPQRYEP